MASLVKLGASAWAAVALIGCGEEDKPLAEKPSEKPSFVCDLACFKAAAQLQGADILSDLNSLKYSMEVTFSGEADSGEGCGGSTNVFPAFDVTVNPSGPSKLTTAETRNPPKVVFECDPTKAYHLLFDDTLGGEFQDTRAYNHWFRFNIECKGGFADASESGVDMVQGTQEIAGWFSGRGYLPPAFGYNTMHHFNFFVFEADDQFTDARLAEIDAEIPSKNELGSDNSSVTVKQFAQWLNLNEPVARSWVDVTTSYWSVVRMERGAKLAPWIRDVDFFKVICPCNQPGNQQGTNSNESAQCNL